MSADWRRDRGAWATGGALLAVATAAWLGVLGQARLSNPGDMPMEGMTIMEGGPALAAALGFVAAWLVMMAAMMLPSATPMVLLYRTVVIAEKERYGANLLAVVFVSGYLLVWGGFGLLVYLAGEAIATVAASSHIVASGLPLATAAVLVIAGLYQFTPLKSVCLRQCRSPMDFLMRRWRSSRGPGGALLLGMDHGIYCLGCCWGLMAVLVAAGAMGLAWVALVALAIFVEKVLPRGEVAGRVFGILLLGLGLAVALDPGLAALLRPAVH